MNQCTPVERKSQVAVVAWGFKKRLDQYPAEVPDAVLDGIAAKYDEVEIWDVRKQSSVAGFRKHFVLDCKGKGIQKVILIAGKTGQDFQVVLGDLAIAGIEFAVVKTIEEKPPVPLTIRYQEIHRKVRAEWIRKAKGKTEVIGEVETGCEVLKGEWTVATYKGVKIWTWKEKVWSYEELASTEMPYGTVWMWKPTDYDEMSMEEGSVPISPPEGIEYPHKLELRGIPLCQVPLRYLDETVGKKWIYGEFAQKLRQWLKQPVIEAELKRFESREMESTLRSDSTGYWDEKDRYIYTGCQGGKAQKDVPVWLTPRDRNGQEIKGRAKYNETLTEGAAQVIEKMGYAELEDQPPHKWVFGAPWLFENVEYEDQEVEERNLDEKYKVLEEGGREKNPSIERWIYNAEVIGDEEKARRNAWYKYEEILSSLDRVEEKARSAEKWEEWNPEGKSLLEEGRDLVLQATPLLREIVGPKAFAYIRERAAEVKAAVQEAAQWCHNGKVAYVASLIQENPELMAVLIRKDLELALEVMEDYPELDSSRRSESLNERSRFTNNAQGESHEHEQVSGIGQSDGRPGREADPGRKEAGQVPAGHQRQVHECVG